MIEHLVPWITVILNAILTGIIGILLKNVDGSIKDQKSFAKKEREDKDKEYKAIRDGVVSLLRDRLYQACFYFLDKGEITDDDRENVDHMYKAYSGLGGDGTGTELWHRTMSLKIVDHYSDDKKNYTYNQQVK